MVKVNIKKIISIALIILTLCAFQTSTFAIEDPEQWNPAKQEKPDNGTFFAKASGVLGWIKYIGIITSIVTLSIIGLKYMFSSVEGKAEYKKTMIPYIIGCLMVASISIFISVISYIAKF